MARLGHHYIAELWDCPHDLLNDRARLESLTLEAARAARVTVINQQFHAFSPQGVTGILLLAESHLSIHTWPELGYAAVDLFTCGDELAAREAVLELASRIRAGRLDLQIIGRGHQDPRAVADAERRTLYPPYQWEAAPVAAEDPGRRYATHAATK